MNQTHGFEDGKWNMRSTERSGSGKRSIGKMHVKHEMGILSYEELRNDHKRIANVRDIREEMRFRTWREEEKRDAERAGIAEATAEAMRRRKALRFKLWSLSLGAGKATYIINLSILQDNEELTMDPDPPFDFRASLYLFGWNGVKCRTKLNWKVKLNFIKYFIILLNILLFFYDLW